MGSTVRPLPVATAALAQGRASHPTAGADADPHLLTISQNTLVEVVPVTAVVAVAARVAGRLWIEAAPLSVAAEAVLVACVATKPCSAAIVAILAILCAA